MTHANAKALADSTLAELKKGTASQGTVEADATTTVVKTVYNGPKGLGWEVRVIQNGKVLPVVTVRHIGGEVGRNKADESLEELKAAALARLDALSESKDVDAVRGIVAAAMTVDDLLGDSLIESLGPNTARCIKFAEAHISTYFTAFGLMEGFRKLVTAQASGTLASIPKTVAVAAWVETVKGMAIAGQTAFPPAPFTFEEVVAE